MSAKTGEGVKDLLEAVVQRLPAPGGNLEASAKAMLIDSWYDPYLGVVVLIRVVDGVFKKNDKIKMMSNGALYQMENLEFLHQRRLM